VANIPVAVITPVARIALTTALRELKLITLFIESARATAGFRVVCSYLQSRVGITCTTEERGVLHIRDRGRRSDASDKAENDSGSEGTHCYKCR
jgi:hypothetical protein